MIKKYKRKNIPVNIFLSHGTNSNNKKNSFNVVTIISVIFSAIALFISLQTMFYTKQSTEAAFKAYDPFFTLKTYTTENNQDIENVNYGSYLEIENIGNPINDLNINMLNYVVINNQIVVPAIYYENNNYTQESTGVVFTANTYSNYSHLLELTSYYNTLSNNKDHISVISVIRIMYTDIQNERRREYFQIMDGLFSGRITEERYLSVINQSKKIESSLILFAEIEPQVIAEYMYEIKIKSER